MHNKSALPRVVDGKCEWFPVLVINEYEKNYCFGTVSLHFCRILRLYRFGRLAPQRPRVVCAVILCGHVWPAFSETLLPHLAA